LKTLTTNFVVPFTIGIFGEYQIVDPTLDEEMVMDGVMFCVIHPGSGVEVFSELVR
jgi:exosome complex RNA-binding protein Rrp42 (RNase PH superfamily)